MVRIGCIDASEQRMASTMQALPNPLDPNPPTPLSEDGPGQARGANESDSKRKRNTKSKKKGGSQIESESQRHHFSCIRNCRYRPEGAAASENVPWSLCHCPLPNMGTLEFDFIASPVVTLRSVRR